MLRLDQLYFRNFSLLFFATLLISSIAGYYLLERIEIDNHRTMLLNMIDEYIAAERSIENPAALVHTVHQRTGVRITIIDDRGKVRFESDRDPTGMENHANRPEILQARTKGVGSAVRRSRTLDRELLYVAKRDGDRYVRMAYGLADIKEKFFDFWLKAIGLFAAAMALAFWIAIKINRKISRDLELIEESLDSMLNKKYEVHFDAVRCCKEFETISEQIAKVSKKLQKRERQKAKYTKNLKMLSKKQSDIISAISHEFKNPVAAIIGYTQTIHDDDHLSREVRIKFLEKVLKNAMKISGMIDRLALAIKLENENFTPTFTRFRVVPLLEEVRDTLLQKYKNREITIEAEEITIEADRTMIDNLMTNLIENALKYSEEEVIVRVDHDRVEVIDEGIGIAAEDIENITKRFFRVDTLTWDNSIGVGLYIVKYILKLHNSYLNIESAPGKGSKFWFDLGPMRPKA